VPQTTTELCVSKADGGRRARGCRQQRLGDLDLLLVLRVVDNQAVRNLDRQVRPLLDQLVDVGVGSDRVSINQARQEGVFELAAVDRRRARIERGERELRRDRVGLDLGGRTARLD
jgi:hypothetical protein